MKKRHLFSRESHIRTRFFKSMFALGTTILIMSSTFSMALIHNAWHTQAKNSFERAYSLFSDMLQQRMLEVNQIAYNILNDFNVRKMVTSSFSGEYDEYITISSVEKTLRTMFTYNNQIRFCIIMEKRGVAYTNLDHTDAKNSVTNSFLSFETCKLNMDEIREYSWYQTASSIVAQTYSHNFYLPGFELSDSMMQAIYKFQYSGDMYGCLVLIIESDWLDPIFSSNSSDMETVILSNSGNVIYSSSEKAVQLASIAQGFTNGSNCRDVSLGDERYSILHEYSQQFDIAVFAAQNLMSLNASLFHVLVGMSIITAIMIAVALIASARQSRRLADPITQIASVLEKSPADVHITPPENADFEIRMLAECINEMSQRIDILLRNMLVTYVAKKNAVIYALKQQVNPHFLYNILETISSMALIKGVDEIASITACLGSMFRYSLENGTDITTLSSEIQHLNNYLEINRLRGIHFESEINIEPRFLEKTVPRLIVQPLVENSFKHGFKGNTREWKLSLSAAETCEGFKLIIIDNGLGMDEHRLAEVRASLSKGAEMQKSIGLNNLHQRIRLEYGEKYGIMLFSSPQWGTRVELTLPEIIEGSTYYEESDML